MDQPLGIGGDARPASCDLAESDGRAETGISTRTRRHLQAGICEIRNQQGRVSECEFAMNFG